MRPTIDQLRGWNLQGLATAGTAARDNARLLDGSLDSGDTSTRMTTPLSRTIPNSDRGSMSNEA